MDVGCFYLFVITDLIYVYILETFDRFFLYLFIAVIASLCRSTIAKYVDQTARHARTVNSRGLNLDAENITSVSNSLLMPY